MLSTTCGSAVTSISACNNLIAYAFGYNVKVVNTLDLNSTSQASKVGPDVVSTAFNDKGALLAYADAKGYIRIKEATKKSNLRDLSHHSKAVYALSFVPQSSFLLAGSDDCSISYSDFGVGRVLHRIGKSHSDCVRSIRSLVGSQTAFVSAGYDKVAKLWDVRDSQKAKAVFNHEAEVEDCQVFDSDSGLVTVGGRLVKLGGNTDKTLGSSYGFNPFANFEQQCQNGNKCLCF